MPLGVGRVVGSQREPELAVREHMRAVGERDGALSPLLDEEDPEAPLADRLERREHEVDDRRREPERRLVEEQDRRLRDERPRDRELLLLAPGERPGRPPAKLVDDRKEREATSARSLSASAERGRAASPSRRFSSTVSSAKRRLPSGTSAIPVRAIASGARPRSDSPAKRTSPPRTRTRPMIACSVVDFPAPFGPMRPTISPGATSNDTPRTAGTPPYATSSPATSSELTVVLLHGRLAEVGGRDVEVLPDLSRRPLRERPSLVEDLDAVADPHDERHVVVDQEHARVVVVAHGAHHRGERGNLCLRETGRGLVHEEEPRLGRERTRDAEPALVPMRERARRRVGVGRQAERLEQLVARRRASRGPAPTPSAATSTFSRTERPRNERLCWNVRESPARPRLCGLQRVTSRPSSSTEPASGKSKPERTFTSVDLPAPFGPISPTTSCRRSSSVTSRSAWTPANERETPAARSEAPDRGVSRLV